VRPSDEERAMRAGEFGRTTQGAALADFATLRPDRAASSNSRDDAALSLDRLRRGVNMVVYIEFARDS
jgi:hypothetical protein